MKEKRLRRLVNIEGYSLSKLRASLSLLLDRYDEVLSSLNDLEVDKKKEEKFLFKVPDQSHSYPWFSYYQGYRFKNTVIVQELEKLEKEIHDLRNDILDKYKAQKTFSLLADQEKEKLDLVLKRAEQKFLDDLKPSSLL